MIIWQTSRSFMALKVALSLMGLVFVGLFLYALSAGGLEANQAGWWVVLVSGCAGLLFFAGMVAWVWLRGFMVLIEATEGNLCLHHDGALKQVRKIPLQQAGDLVEQKGTDGFTLSFRWKRKLVRICTVGFDKKEVLERVARNFEDARAHAQAQSRVQAQTQV